MNSLIGKKAANGSRLMKQMKMMKTTMSLFLIMVMFPKMAIYGSIQVSHPSMVTAPILVSYLPTSERVKPIITVSPVLMKNQRCQPPKVKCRRKGYQASFPSLINVEGHPTYIMVLKDASGLVKLYAAVNVEQYNIVTTASSQTECLNRYKQLLGIESGSADNNNNQPDNSTGTDNDAPNSVTGSSDISEPTVADAETNLTITDIKYIDITVTLTSI